MTDREKQPVFRSGMRGKEKADKAPAAQGKAKTAIKRLSIERGDTGYRIDVERHPEPPKKDKDGKEVHDPMSYERLREQHMHNSKESAVAHHTALMDEMGPGPGAPSQATEGAPVGR